MLNKHFCIALTGPRLSSCSKRKSYSEHLLRGENIVAGNSTCFPPTKVSPMFMYRFTFINAYGHRSQSLTSRWHTFFYGLERKNYVVKPTTFDKPSRAIHQQNVAESGKMGRTENGERDTISAYTATFPNLRNIHRFCPTEHYIWTGGYIHLVEKYIWPIVHEREIFSLQIESQ